MLGLDSSLRIAVYTDANPPLNPATPDHPAHRIQLSYGHTRYFFIAQQTAHGALVFSLIAPCSACNAPVPSVVIEDLADFGDALLNSPRAHESPLLRSSPVHRRGCPIPATIAHP